MTDDDDPTNESSESIKVFHSRQADLKMMTAETVPEEILR
jgi:hypothetical protein